MFNPKMVEIQKVCKTGKFGEIFIARDHTDHNQHSVF